MHEKIEKKKSTTAGRFICIKSNQTSSSSYFHFLFGNNSNKQFGLN